MYVLLSAGNITTELEKKKGKSNLCPINNLLAKNTLLGWGKMALRQK